jgi:hypothetical protein
MLDAKGSPTVTERAWIVPPRSRIGPITDAERAAVREQTKPLYGHYEQTIDRESAYERIKSGAGQAGRAGTAGQAGRAGTATGSERSGGADAAGTAASSAGSSITDALSAILMGTTGPRGGHHDGLLQSAAKSAARSVGSGFGRAILRGALGSILGGSTRRSR